MNSNGNGTEGDINVQELKDIANILRIHAITSTDAGKSGLAVLLRALHSTEGG